MNQRLILEISPRLTLKNCRTNSEWNQIVMKKKRAVLCKENRQFYEYQINKLHSEATKTLKSVFNSKFVQNTYKHALMSF